MKKYIIICLFIFSLALSQIPLKKKIIEQYPFELKNSSIPLVYLSDFNYYTEFLIGTPQQKVDWLQDTWVGETWLNLNITNQSFVPSKSTTFNITKTPGQYNYTLDVGMVYGYYGSEVIGIQEINLTALKIPILFGENGTGRGATYTGSVGLANNLNYKNWLQIAVQNKVFPDSIFAYDLRYGDYFYASSITFPKNSQITDLTWFSTRRQNYWSMGLFTSTSIDSISYPQEPNSLEAVWDSGCVITYITLKAFNALIASPQVSKYCQLNPTYQLYFCPCNQTYPNITAHSEKMDFKTISQDYMFEMSGGYCVLGIIDNPQNWAPFMIFGTTMFKSYFVAYDKVNGRIGFSKGKYPSDIKESILYFVKNQLIYNQKK